MAINIFRKKQTQEGQTKKQVKEKQIKEEPVKQKEKSVNQEVKKKESVKTAKILGDKKFEVWKILKAPHITEKTSFLMQDNFYTFEVMPKANKAEIKQAIESEYNVNVVDIKIINIPRKKVQRGKIIGHKKGYRKALIKLKSGQKIDIITQ